MKNLPFALIDFLEKKGFRVNHLKKMGKSGIKNGAVYEIAEQSKSWIITRDADFESYHKFKSHEVAGVILFKLKITRTQYLLSIMKKFLESHEDKLSTKHLIIIDDTGFRIYK